MINYYLLTKPGIILGNLLPFTAGFLLASKGRFDFRLFLASLLGLALIIASACVCNNIIDRHRDKMMSRTKNRPMAAGRITTPQAFFFAFVLGLLGAFLLYFETNVLTLGVSAVGFLVYVLLYSLWKGKTIYATAIGSIAGAVPPVIGYTAVSNRIDEGALIFFFMMLFWQMPHFYAIALYHLSDYKRANLPLLPIERGSFRTKIHMLVYIQAFILTALLLSFWNYTGTAYLVVTAVISFAWLILCFKGFGTSNDELWGRRMFQLSLITICTICLAIPLDLAGN